MQNYQHFPFEETSGHHVFSNNGVKEVWHATKEFHQRQWRKQGEEFNYHPKSKSDEEMAEMGYTYVGVAPGFINLTNLMQAGYKFFRPSRMDAEKGYVGSYEKRFTDDNGIRYSLLVDVLSYEAANKEHVAYAPKAQFRTLEDDDDLTFNIEMILNVGTTIDEMESFFERMWEKMELKYYERYDPVVDAMPKMSP
jgi:hypothetical protein